MKNALTPLKDAALWVAGISGVVYLIGSLSLSSYYARFGLPESELDFSVPYVMSSSLLPLLFPAFWLAMVAAACVLFSRGLLRPENASPFFPIPGAKAVAYTLSFCAVHTLLAVIGGPRAPVFIGWTTRGIVLTGLGLVAFVIVYRNARRDHIAGPPPRVSRGTTYLSGLIALAVGLGCFQLVTGQRTWPYSNWQSLFLLGGAAFAAGSAWWEYRKARTKLATTGEWKQPRLDANPPEGRLAGTIFVGTLAVMALLLQAGLSGTVEADKILSGCRGTKSIAFDPMPTGLENQTLLLVLHSREHYYVIGLNKTVGLHIISETPGMQAAFGWSGATRNCERGF